MILMYQSFIRNPATTPFIKLMFNSCSTTFKISEAYCNLQKKGVNDKNSVLKVLFSDLTSLSIYVNVYLYIYIYIYIHYGIYAHSTIIFVIQITVSIP